MLSALGTPSFPNNKRLVCHQRRLRGVCSAKHKDVQIQTICGFSGSGGYVRIARVPCSASVRTVVAGIVRLTGTNGLGRIGSVHGRASLGNLGVAVSLGHNASPSGLVGHLCTLAPLRSSFNYGFGILINNIPRIVKIHTLLSR